jgi:hypothetical protein
VSSAIPGATGGKALPEVSSQTVSVPSLDPPRGLGSFGRTSKGLLVADDQCGWFARRSDPNTAFLLKIPDFAEVKKFLLGSR